MEYNFKFYCSEFNFKMAGNESPPKISFDYALGQVERPKIYLTHLGTPCEFMHLLPEDAFITPSNSEETDLSSDESINSKDSSIVPTTSISTSQKIKEEKLSDAKDISKPKDTSKTKAKKGSSSKSKKWSGVEYSTSDDSGDEKRRPRRTKISKEPVENDQSKVPQKKECSSKSVKDEFEEEEYKYTPEFSAAFGNYHCQVCDITVNSEVTYKTHLLGKRHHKALKAKAVPEVAIQSLNEPRLPPPLAGVPSVSSRRTRRIPLREESLIQLVVEGYRDGPLPGLSEVVEIRPAVEGSKEVAYLCNLCEAQCVPNSIMKHLTGFKHYLRCLETIDPLSYEKYRFGHKKVIEAKVRRILLDYERRRGRGRIRVEQEVDDQHSMRCEPGPSWREGGLPSVAPSVAGSDDSEFVSAMEHLDTSMSDFYCKSCDAHMNNKAMWESHVRGKRHLKNVKKVPGESTSKVKSFPCPEATANLMRLLDETERVDQYNNPMVIVGLDFIKETQNEGGDLYNCYLCGACTSSYDIIEHLNQPKHKVRYLETINARGMENSIENIKSLSDVSAFSKECMIDEECRNALEKYGEGRVSVYKSKDIYAPSTYGPRY